METERITKVVTKVKLGQRKSDAAYWRTRTPQERLEVAEEIRREYHRWRYGVEPGFQRVYRIVRR